MARGKPSGGFARRTEQITDGRATLIEGLAYDSPVESGSNSGKFSEADDILPPSNPPLGNNPGCAGVQHLIERCPIRSGQHPIGGNVGVNNRSNP